MVSRCDDTPKSRLTHDYRIRTDVHARSTSSRDGVVVPSTRMRLGPFKHLRQRTVRRSSAWLTLCRADGGQQGGDRCTESSFALIVFALLGLIPTAFVVSIIDWIVPGRLRDGLEFVIGVVAYICVVLGLANLYKRLTTQRVSVCQHRGSTTRSSGTGRWRCTTTGSWRPASRSCPPGGTWGRCWT